MQATCLPQFNNPPQTHTHTHIEREIESTLSLSPTSLVLITQTYSASYFCNLPTRKEYVYKPKLIFKQDSLQSNLAESESQRKHI